MKNLNLQDLIIQAMIGALYVVLVFLLYNFSYGQVQFRVAEALLVLVFFNKKNVIGLLLGTFIANFFGDFGIIDAVLGTLTTGLVLYFMILFKKLVPLALIFPVIFNAIYVGLLLYFMIDAPFLLSASYVAIGEFAVVYLVGLPLYYLLFKNKAFMELIEK